MRATLALLLAPALTAAAAGCHRPVTGRDGPTAIISDVDITPRFVRDRVPLDVSFASSARPATLDYVLGGARFPCTPALGDDARFHCVDPDGISAGDVAEGFGILSVEALSENGKSSAATATVTIDFTCPRLLSLSISSALVRPGDQSIMILELSEPLGEPPSVTRAGRTFGTTVGANHSFIVVHVATEDEAPVAPIEVALRDRAGNTSGDCNADGSLPFIIDKSPPSIDPLRVLITRGAPGAPSTISASAGAFIDDTGVVEVDAIDAADHTPLGAFVPAADGSLAAATLLHTPKGRVLLSARDRLEQTSAPVSVNERWTLSIGSGSAAKSAIRTAARLTPPHPESAFLTNQTFALAPELSEHDTRVAEIPAAMGFVPAGHLPNSYENAFQIAAGYDRQNAAIVGFGGLVPDSNNYAYLDQTLILRWNESAGAYSVELPSTPQPTRRYSSRIAFDDAGCGLMFGGEGLDPDDPISGVYLNDLWQICGTDQGYTWTRQFPANPFSGPSRRFAPIARDPIRGNYLIAAGDAYRGNIRPPDLGEYYPSNEIFTLSPRGGSGWIWARTSTPTGFVSRYYDAAYWDPVLSAYGIGLGVLELDELVEHAYDFWFLGDQSAWTLSLTPPNLGLFDRQGFGYDYDEARHQLVLWGDNGGQCLPNPCTDPFPLVLILTSTTPAIGPSAWRYTDLDPPVPRAWPTLVWDRDREVFVMFGGTRYDARFVPPDIYALITEPAYPYLSMAIDLETDRPAGIADLVLRVRARGTGDADGIGPGTTAAEGIVASLWDQDAGAWVEVIDRGLHPGSGLIALTATVSDRPERFVRADGVVEILLRPTKPGTEAVPGRLDIDELRGELRLRPSP